MTHKKTIKNGFTLIELMIVLALIGILCIIAVPKINDWLPRYRLKSAASDLQSNMQKARMLAIKENNSVQIRFDNSVSPGFYYFDTINDDVYTAGEFRVDLSTYKFGVDFGSGAAVSNWNNTACTQATAISFGTRGTANQATVYLQNQDILVCYAVTTSIAGTGKLRIYTGNNWIE